jgi:hypothetical protein
LAAGGLLKWETGTDVRYVSGRKQVRCVSIGMDDSLTTWASYCQAAEHYGATQARLWGALIRAVDVNDQDETEEWAIVSTHAFASPWQAIATGGPRWRIENTGFRELKGGWHLEHAPWSYTDDTVVAAHVALR